MHYSVCLPQFPAPSFVPLDQVGWGFRSASVWELSAHAIDQFWIQLDLFQKIMFNTTQQVRIVWLVTLKPGMHLNMPIFSYYA